MSLIMDLTADGRDALPRGIKWLTPLIAAVIVIVAIIGAVVLLAILGVRYAIFSLAGAIELFGDGTGVK